MGGQRWRGKGDEPFRREGFGEGDGDDHTGTLLRKKESAKYVRSVCEEPDTLDGRAERQPGRWVELTSSFLHAIRIGLVVDELDETDARSGDSSMSGVTVCHFWADGRFQTREGVGELDILSERFGGVSRERRGTYRV